MTLDEAIKHAEEVAEEKRYEYQDCLAVHDMENAMVCGKCGEEHEQLAEWLKELKKFREQEPCEMTAEEYRQRMIQAFHNADCDELIALVVLPTEKEFEHLGWLLEKHYKAKPEPCEDCISKANALRVAKNEYLRGWHDALCKALSEKYSIHCEEGNFSVIQEETITGLGLLMDCAIGKDVESYMSTLPSVTPTRKKGKWISIYGNVKCSVCGNIKDGRSVGKATHYCDFCGAKMEEVKK